LEYGGKVFEEREGERLVGAAGVARREVAKGLVVRSPRGSL
jgi:hypothetical protein